ncbi:MAG TPA: DUF4147 domain-containing protein [Gemmatimonadales bacterium]|nr:DUF4147 domain-containing protein [Gemmatimonadales bacterium]
MYRAALNGADPARAVAHALERQPLSGATAWLIATGKSARPMSQAALEWMTAHGIAFGGGVAVTAGRRIGPAPLEVIIGDHPEPGPQSVAAANRIADVIRRIGPDDQVLVLISGGTSSLIGAPVEGVTLDELRRLSRLLLGSGMDIHAMNLIRKRFSRWAAGRMAAALAPHPVRGLLLSDVLDDDPAAIGSGPLSPDPATASDVEEMLRSANLYQQIAPAMRDQLAAVVAERRPETPKPGQAVFAHVSLEIVANNSAALRGVSAAAQDLGWDTTISRTLLQGDAAAMGKMIGCQLAAAGPRQTKPRCWIWGGETTVRLGPAHGTGGRSQELALAAARELVRWPGITLLAAGTDGRDGPTDAAGAIVDSTTWQAIAAAGRDPAGDLARHDSHPALAAAGALFRPGLTGVNVMDVVVAIESGV